MYQGSRQAETFRGCWDHSSVPAVDGQLPVWGLGLAGVLKQFQDRRGTGFTGTYYHAKGYMDFSSPDHHDILPASCSGLCLASIITLCFTVLMYLQPTSPSEPIARKPARRHKPSSSQQEDSDCTDGDDGASSSGGETSSRSTNSSAGHQQNHPSDARSAGSAQQLTANNICGFMFPYGGLQHLGEPGQASARLINTAVTAAKFLNNSFTGSKGKSCLLANVHANTKQLCQPGQVCVTEVLYATMLQVKRRLLLDLSNPTTAVTAQACTP